MLFFTIVTGSKTVESELMWVTKTEQKGTGENSEETELKMY